MSRSLTKNQQEVVNGLAYLRLHPDQTSRQDGWATPMDFGGTDGSHHSGTARALVRRGLVAINRYRTLAGGASFAYKITEAGFELADDCYRRTAPEKDDE